MFVAVPGVGLLISLLYSASIAGGVVVTLLALSALAGLIFWWYKFGCYKVVSQEERDARKAEMEKEMGDLPEAEAAPEAAV